MTNDEKRLEFECLEMNVIIPYLKSVFPAIKSVCCLYHMIEQGEDIYTYLIDGVTVITIEISRLDGTIITDSSISVQEYAKMKKGKQFQNFVKELLILSQRKDFHL